MKSAQIQSGFFPMPSRGEEVVSTLTNFCEEQGIHWAQLQAIGAVEDVEIGYYDLGERKYVFCEESRPFEVDSIEGNIAEVHEKPIAHIHATLSRCNESLEAIGGHIRRARVALTLKVALWLISRPLVRSFDEDTNPNFINLEAL